MHIEQGTHAIEHSLEDGRVVCIKTTTHVDRPYPNDKAWWGITWPSCREEIARMLRAISSSLKSSPRYNCTSSSDIRPDLLCVHARRDDNQTGAGESLSGGVFDRVWCDGRGPTVSVVSFSSRSQAARIQADVFSCKKGKASKQTRQVLRLLFPPFSDPPPVRVTR